MDFALSPPTAFAPALRSSRLEVEADYRAILGNGAAIHLAEAIGQPAALVNEGRQVVFANRHFLEFVHATDVNAVLGMRLGELLGCKHATGSLGGCGTHQSCRECTAITAILHALDGTAETMDVELTVERTGTEEKLPFAISAVPVRLQQRTLALLQFRTLADD